MKRLLLSTALALISIGQPLLFGTTAAVIRAAPQKEQAMEPWQVPWFHFERAWHRWQSGDLSGALADYDIAIKHSPGWVQAYSLRGDVKRDLGNMSGACTDWKKYHSLKADSDWKKYQALKANADRKNYYPPKIESFIKEYQSLKADPRDTYPEWITSQCQ